MPPPLPPSRPPRAGLAILLLISAATLGLPLAGLTVDILNGLRAPGPPHPWWWLSWASIGRSLFWAAIIGILASLLGLPIAWACRRARSRAAALLLAPALLPAFLAYSGWGMLRAPMSATGAWIDAQRQAGWDWLPHTVDTILAIGGLVLWAAPLAAGCMLPGMRALGDDVLDAARLDARGLGWLRALAPALARPMAFSALAVAGLMLGSAIPLHLARVDTAAIALWFQMDLTPPDRHWQVWLAGWPLILAALAFAWAAARAARGLGDQLTADPPPSDRPAGLITRLAAAAVVATGTLVPIALFAAQLKSTSSIPRYWRAHHAAFTTSAGIALLVAALGTLLAAAAWHAASTGRTRPVRALAAAWTTAAILPGVMTGAAIARGFTLLSAHLPDALDPAEGILPIVAGHTARLGFLAVWLGLWLAAAEPSDARDTRRLDGAETPWAWARAAAASRAGALTALTAALVALSLHEIEASVLTLWPGGMMLGRQLLNELHFLRAEELGAAVVLLTITLAPAVALAALAGKPPPRRPPTPGPNPAPGPASRGPSDSTMSVE